MNSEFSRLENTFEEEQRREYYENGKLFAKGRKDSTSESEAEYK